MTLPVLLLGLLPALLVASAFYDLTSFTIPNALPAAMLVLFVLLLLAMVLNGHPVSWSEMWLHLLAGGCALAIGMALFAAGWVGGGDAKLFAAACLWLGWDALFQYTMVS